MGRRMLEFCLGSCVWGDVIKQSKMNKVLKQYVGKKTKLYNFYE